MHTLLCHKLISAKLGEFFMETSSKDLVGEYDKLCVTLTRPFLSMLSYKHDYYDWVHQKWMKMDDVLAT
jgi:hypothetical protein